MNLQDVTNASELSFTLENMGGGYMLFNAYPTPNVRVCVGDDVVAVCLTVDTIHDDEVALMSVYRDSDESASSWASRVAHALSVYVLAGV